MKSMGTGTILLLMAVGAVWWTSRDGYEPAKTKEPKSSPFVATRDEMLERAAPAPTPASLVVAASNEKERATISRAYDVLLASCPPLRVNYIPKALAIDGRMSTIYVRNRETRAAEIAIKLPEDGKPGSGHTLWYWLVGGKKAGIRTSKAISRTICNMGPDDDFRAVPALSFVK